MKVHVAAKQLGVTPRALRFYEEKGLLKPRKEEENGYRDYSEDNINQLRWIIALRELGLPVTAIGKVLEALALDVEQTDPAGSDNFIRQADEVRAELYAEWIEQGRRLQALDRSIAVWRSQQSAPDLEAAESSTLQLKQSRIERMTWSDRWHYDELALVHGQDAPLAALASELTLKQYENALLQIVEWLDPRPQESGLELGAGTGNLTALLIAQGAVVTAIEQSQEMLAVLRARLPAAEPRLGNLLTLPVSGPSYRFIASSFAFRHLEPNQLLLALIEADRVLLPAGRLAIADRHDTVSPLRRWLEEHNYSIVTEILDGGLMLLYAVKP
ncbi:MerR family transcriptional regulator [Paenibacillus gorillae]|uniref:MerR family transcriptional regulator n=1 Tax=Paenibacillus gorillae TaxID=1243662 RepID=UPI0004AF3B2B|nr:MerR family transcriptional regulator [Paenibacillus gorillae]